jgi:hypothetical protein
MPPRHRHRLTRSPPRDPPRRTGGGGQVCRAGWPESAQSAAAGRLPGYGITGANAVVLPNCERLAPTAGRACCRFPMPDAPDAFERQRAGVAALIPVRL